MKDMKAQHPEVTGFLSPPATPLQNEFTNVSLCIPHSMFRFLDDAYRYH
jgi:hypothetical protein